MSKSYKYIVREQSRAEYKKGKCVGCCYKNENQCTNPYRCVLEIGKIYNKEEINVSDNITE